MKMNNRIENVGRPQVGSAKRIWAQSACAAALIIGWHGAALAQEKPVESGVQDIIVTAQKREQRLQDVPVAVTAITADTLQVNRVANVMDLNGLAPGLLARANAGSTGSPSYSMRGVFASGSDPAQDREIATYVDGVYIGGVRGAIFDMPDIQRVEVLRGPQGTLFGRNATAGAVSITTRDPAGKLKFRQEVSVGDHNSLRTRTTLDTPRFGIFSAFATFVHDERRGDIRNLGAGTPTNYTSPLQNIVGNTTSPEWLGSKNANSVFVALKLEPSDTFNITYKFDWTHNNNTPDARVPLWNSSLLGGIVALQGADTTYGGYYQPAQSSNPQRVDAVNNAFAATGFTEASGHVVTVNWRATENVSIKNVAAYRTASALGISSIMGVDGLTVTQGVIDNIPSIYGFPAYTQAKLGQEIVGYGGVNYGNYSQFSDELQANYHSSLLTLTAGALYFKSHELLSGLPGSPTNYGVLVGLGALGQPGTVFSDNLSMNPANPFLLGNVQEKHQSTKSMAVYAQAEVHITPQLDLVLGGRLTKDDKSQTFNQGGTYNPALNSISGERVTTTPYSKTKPTFSAGLNYRPTHDFMVYGKYSTAYLSGGASGPLVFAPETVSSWEGGLKSEWFDRRLRFNLAVYNADYSNSQSAQSGSNVTSAACGTSGLPVSCAAYGVVVVSNGSIRSRGFEAEATVVPATGLTIGGSLSYSQNKWLNPSPVLTDGGRPVAPNGIPAWMASLNAQYITPPVFGDSTMLFRIDGNYQGSYRNSPFLDIATHPADNSTNPAEAPWAIAPSRWILNSRIALRDIKVGGLNGELAVWARNLTDNKDATYTLIFGALNVDASYQQARTLGADFILNF